MNPSGRWIELHTRIDEADARLTRRISRAGWRRAGPCPRHEIDTLHDVPEQQPRRDVDDECWPWPKPECIGNADARGQGYWRSQQTGSERSRKKRDAAGETHGRRWLAGVWRAGLPPQYVA